MYARLYIHALASTIDIHDPGSRTTFGTMSDVHALTNSGNPFHRVVKPGKNAQKKGKKNSNIGDDATGSGSGASQSTPAQSTPDSIKDAPSPLSGITSGALMPASQSHRPEAVTSHTAVSSSSVSSQSDQLNTEPSLPVMPSGTVIEPRSHPSDKIYAPTASRPSSTSSMQIDTVEEMRRGVQIRPSVFRHSNADGKEYLTNDADPSNGYHYVIRIAPKTYLKTQNGKDKTRVGVNDDYLTQDGTMIPCKPDVLFFESAGIFNEKTGRMEGKTLTNDQGFEVTRDEEDNEISHSHPREHVSDDEYLQKELSNAEIAERDAKLNEGSDGLYTVLQAADALPEEVAKAYKKKEGLFIGLWYPARRPALEPRLQEISNAIKDKQYDVVKDITRSIVDISKALDSKNDLQDRIRFEVIKLIDRVTRVGMDYNKLAPQSVKERLWELFQKDEAEEARELFLAASVKATKEQARVASERMPAIIENLGKCLNGTNASDATRAAVIMAVEETNADIRKANFVQLLKQADHLLPVAELRQALDTEDLSHRQNRIFEFLKATEFMFNYSVGADPDGEFSRSRLGEGAKWKIIKACYLGYQEDPEQPRLATPLTPSLFHPLSTKAPLSTPALGHVSASDTTTSLQGVPRRTFLPEGIAELAEGLSSEYIQFGIVAHVRKLGGRYASYRAIVNIGTEDRTVFECIPGSDFGRGEGEKLKTFLEDDPPLKDREKSDIARPLHIVEVRPEVRTIRLDREGKRLGCREPITYFQIQWSEKGLRVAGTPEKSWVARSDLIKICGKRTVQNWRAQLVKKYDHNKIFLEECIKDQVFPDTGKRLTADNLRRYPWLAPRESASRVDKW